MWKRSSNLNLIQLYTTKVIEDLEKAFGVKRYKTDSGAHKKSAIGEDSMFSVRIPDEDTIHVIECENSQYGYSIFIDGYTMALYSFVNKATYLYERNSQQLYIIKNGTVTFQDYYPYILTKEDFALYMEDDEIDDY